MSIASTAAAAAAAISTTALKLPSPLQVIVAKPVSMTVILGLFTLALLSSSTADEEMSTTWKTPPALETFTSYEDMQRYFDHRNQRRLRHIENPFGDSYIEAYNQHNEQEEVEELRTKRSASQQSENKNPVLIKFEVSDAVEPSEEVKQLIRQYKSRDLKQNEKHMETISPSNVKNSDLPNKAVVKRTLTNVISKQKVFGKRLNRPKRSMSQQQQPANFKVQYIPFEVADAREPDPQTKKLIKRMRALEIEKLTKEIPFPAEDNKSSPERKAVVSDATTTTTKPPFNKRSKFVKQWKPKRIKREVTAPEMIKFEISDAKNPDLSLKTFMNVKRDSKDLKLDSKSNIKSTKTADTDTATATSEQSAQASKRYFVIKEAPTKVKKSIAAIPHDVQNIISHLIKGGGGGVGGGKAYLKYIPTQQMDYNNLKVAYPIAKGGAGLYGHGAAVGGGYGHGGAGGYGKYAHAVPVKFVYHPVVVGAVGGHGSGYKVGGGGEGIAHGTEEIAAANPAAAKYVSAVVGKGAHGSYAEAWSGGHNVPYSVGDDYGGGGKDGNSGVYVAAAAADKDHAGKTGNHDQRYAAAGGNEAAYGLAHEVGADAHPHYATSYSGGYAGRTGASGHADGGDGGYITNHASAAIVHPIIVAEGGEAKATSYGAGYAKNGVTKNAGNEAIKAIPAPQFKGKVKYSAVPTVEQYAKTATQDFQLKLYSPESLIAKAQLIAKDQANQIAEESQKAVAAAYKLVAGKGTALYGAGKEGYGSSGDKGAGYGRIEKGFGFKIEEEAQGGGGKRAAGYGGAEGGFGFKIGGEGLGGVGDYKAYRGREESEGDNGGLKGSSFGNAAGPIIKIEYHAPAETFKNNYKETSEFQQLSSLVGKSPEDQIHGLTYLLAKEMQNRLHLQRQHNFGSGGGSEGLEKGASDFSGEEGLEARPQDNKAPILFQSQGTEALGEGLASEAHKGGSRGFYQPIVGKYFSMAKSKPYIPVIEQAAGEDFKDTGEALGAKAGDGGGKQAVNAYGLSPNYKGLSGLKGYGAGGKAAAGGKAFNAKNYEEAASKLQSYASKYAFGYRIRDFHTGNDFGHKQNRDLHGVTRGQYHILLPDGRIQNVIYHADDTGFHADVSFESGRR